MLNTIQTRSLSIEWMGFVAMHLLTVNWKCWIYMWTLSWLNMFASHSGLFYFWNLEVYLKNTTMLNLHSLQLNNKFSIQSLSFVRAKTLSIRCIRFDWASNEKWKTWKRCIIYTGWLSDWRHCFATSSNRKLIELDHWGVFVRNRNGMEWENWLNTDWMPMLNEHRYVISIIFIKWKINSNAKDL